MDDLYYMKIAYEQALKAQSLDEVPVGAIIVKDNEIISKAYNLKEHLNMATCHAEIIAIEEAEKVLNTWYLDDCTLYVTLEPCMMCTGAIIQSRVKKVVFGAYEKRWSSLTSLIESQNINHYPEVIEGIYEEECSSLLSNYFKSKR